MKMKLYNLQSLLDFGRFSGQSLKEVFLKDPEYIEDCIFDVPNFCFNPDHIEALEDLDPDFAFTDEAFNKLESKFESYENEENSFDDIDSYNSEDLMNLGIGDKFSDEFEDLGDADGGFYEDDYSF